MELNKIWDEIINNGIATESEPIEISEEQLSDKKFELECQGISYNYRIIA